MNAAKIGSPTLEIRWASEGMLVLWWLGDYWINVVVEYLDEVEGNEALVLQSLMAPLSLL